MRHPSPSAARCLHVAKNNRLGRFSPAWVRPAGRALGALLMASALACVQGGEVAHDGRDGLGDPALPPHISSDNLPHHRVPPGSLMTTDAVDHSRGLAGYIDYALAHNPDLRAGFEHWQAEIQKIPQVRALPEPELTWTHFIEEIQTRTGPQENKFSLSQSFPWFGTLGLRGQIQARHADHLRWDLEATKLDLIAEVKGAYSEYGYLAHAIEMTEATLHLLLQLEPVVQTKLRAGAGQADLLKLQVTIGRVEDELKSLLARRPALSARLAAALGASGTDLFPWPKEGENELADFPELAEEGLSELVRLKNPSIQSHLAQVEAARLELELARLSNRPRFTVGVDYFQTGDATMSTPGSGDDPYSVSLGMSLPIRFRKYAAERSEALYHERGAEAGAQRVMLQKQTQLATLLFRIDDARRQTLLYRDTLIPRAQQTAEISRLTYETGRMTLLEVIDAEREVFQLEKLYWRSIANYRQKIADLEALCGGEL